MNTSVKIKVIWVKIWDVFQFNYVITHNCGCQLEASVTGEIYHPFFLTKKTLKYKIELNLQSIGSNPWIWNFFRFVKYKDNWEKVQTRTENGARHWCIDQEMCSKQACFVTNPWQSPTNFSMTAMNIHVSAKSVFTAQKLNPRPSAFRADALTTEL